MQKYYSADHYIHDICSDIGHFNDRHETLHMCFLDLKSARETQQLNKSWTHHKNSAEMAYRCYPGYQHLPEHSRKSESIYRLATDFLKCFQSMEQKKVEISFAYT